MFEFKDLVMRLRHVMPYFLRLCSESWYFTKFFGGKTQHVLMRALSLYTFWVWTSQSYPYVLLMSKSVLSIHAYAFVVNAFLCLHFCAPKFCTCGSVWLESRQSEVDSSMIYLEKILIFVLLETSYDEVLEWAKLSRYFRSKS